MTLSTSQPLGDAATEHMLSVFNQQRAAFNAQPYPDLDDRRRKLFQIKKQIINLFLLF